MPVAPPARALLKRLLWRARELPDAAYGERMRERLRAAFRAAPAPHEDAAGHAAALARGEAVASELDALLRLAKYRALRGR